MTKFGEKLMRYRKKAGLTQEALAEALGVSRQAVGKWESGATYPETEKLPLLADVLGCSLDALLRGDGEEEPEESETEPEPQPEVEQQGTESAAQEPPAPETMYDGLSLQEVFDAYDTHMDHFSLQIAVGVALVLTGVAAMLFFETGSERFATCIMMLFVAAAVALFIVAGIRHGAFWRAYPAVPDLYEEARKRHFLNAFGVGIACSVGVILVDVAVFVLTVEPMEGMPGTEAAQDRATAFFMLVLAGAVAALVFLGIQYAKYHLDDRSKYIVPEDEERRVLRDERIPDEARQELEEKVAGKSGWSGVIMSGATIVFFLGGFLLNGWAWSWIAFPIGGMICAAASNMKTK